MKILYSKCSESTATHSQSQFFDIFGLDSGDVFGLSFHFVAVGNNLSVCFRFQPSQYSSRTYTRPSMKRL